LLSGYNTTLTPLAGTQDPTNIPRAPAGTAQDNYRTGSRIKITKIFLNYEFHAGASIPVAYARLMLVRWPRNNGSSMITADILQWTQLAQGALTSLKETECPYQILFDRLIPYGNQQQFSGQSHRKTVLDFTKNPLLVDYNDQSTAGSPSDVSSGQMTWYLACDDGTGTALITSRVEWYNV